MPRPSVLCPVDFSDASRSALRYAAAVADHFGARLTILTVDDPLLAEAAAAMGIESMADESRSELRRFSAETVETLDQGPKSVDIRVATGKPGPEILRVARELHADLIVISSHGRSGVRKRFFGSTAERVLRETDTPVLVTPEAGPPSLSLSEIARHIHRILVPVDLTPASTHQVQVAAAIARAIAAPLILAHVVEPIFVPHRVRLALPGAEAARRAQAEDAISSLAAAAGTDVTVESLVAIGEPSEEIDRLARARRANLIVMGLHSSGMFGPRMGSVTYRVLSLTHALVLALPPVPEPAAEKNAFYRQVQHGPA